MLESDSPFELASDLASVICVVVAPMVSEAAVRSRARSAIVVVSMTLIATAAPIATSLPAADAFESRLELRSSAAVIDASPVTVSAAPVPRCAETLSLTIAI